MLKEKEEKNPAASCSGSERPPTLITTSTTAKKKTSKKETVIYQPPKILVCHLMQPIRLSSKENTAISLNTNVVKTIRISFVKYLEENLMVDGGDDDSTECIAECGFRKNIIVPFCKELARAILGDTQARKVNKYCILFLLNYKCYLTLLFLCS